MTEARAQKQRGAALIIVLLLVATLAFISLAISERAMLSARRTVNTRLADVLAWRAVAVETLAKNVIETQMKESKGRLSFASPLTARPVVFPIEGGSATIGVVDRTRCFNVNSLVSAKDEATAPDEEAVKEFEQIVDMAGLADIDSSNIAASIVDWIDANGFQEPGGAEDSIYSTMPTPYRTGGQRLADVSELRAIAGVSSTTYRAVSPFLCAQPSSKPSPVNINMLTAGDAPLLVAISKGKVSRGEAEDIIAATPPGGYSAIDQFTSNDKIHNLGVKEFTDGSFNVWSSYLEADAAIDYRGARLDLSLIFEVSEDGKARLISRRLGRFE